MAVSLAEAAILSDNELQAAIIETFVDQSPVLARLPFMEIEGNAYQYTQELSLPGIAFRARERERGMSPIDLLWLFIIVVALLAAAAWFGSRALRGGTR